MALRDAAPGDTAVRDPAPQRRVAVPADPVTIAGEIRAAPMASGQQVEVLNVVARLAILIRDMRAENSALKARVESTADRFDTAVGDFDRRLALAEAKGALNAAMGAEASVHVSAGHAAGIASTDVQGASGVGGRSRSSAPPAAVQIVPAAASDTAAPAGVARYRVTAASPGLAMLALLDRSGGEGSQIQVAVGDQVSGYGRVTAIQQRGSSWIVQTDKGPDKGVIQ